MNRVTFLGATLVAGICLTACAPSPATTAPSAPPSSPAASTPAAVASTVVPTPPAETSTPTPEVITPAASTPPVEASTPAVSTPAVDTSASPTATMPAGAVFTTAQVRAYLDAPATAPGKLVFLTFDDGPNTSVTPKILDALKAAEVHATFFVVGTQVPEAPQVLQREVDEGHKIALHSLTHDYKKMYPGRSANAARVALEFDETMAAVRTVLGSDFSTTAWRYPGGHMSWKNMAASDAELDARGASWLDWNAMTGDAEPKKRRPTSVTSMVAMATEPIAAGTTVVVMLAHDSGGKDLTVASLPKIIDAYKAAGYTFGTLS